MTTNRTLTDSDIEALANEAEAEAEAGYDIDHLVYESRGVVGRQLVSSRPVDPR